MLRPGITTVTIVLVALTFAGCGSDDHDRTSPAAEPGEPVSPAPPPDAGTATGHAGDDARVSVPDDDPSPPQATVVLGVPGEGARARAAQPGGGESGTVTLDAPVVDGTTTGRDPESGIARVRVSLDEVVECRTEAGEAYTRLRTRYLPPPEIERVRAAPGARLATERRRSARLRLSRERCGAEGVARRIEGELWGEVINGLGLEAVTPHIRFVWKGAAIR
jgi:hypothetical protein